MASSKALELVAMGGCWGRQHQQDQVGLKQIHGKQFHKHQKDRAGKRPLESLCILEYKCDAKTAWGLQTREMAKHADSPYTVSPTASAWNKLDTFIPHPVSIFRNFHIASVSSWCWTAYCILHSIEGCISLTITTRWATAPGTQKRLFFCGWCITEVQMIHEWISKPQLMHNPIVALVQEK